MSALAYTLATTMTSMGGYSEPPRSWMMLTSSPSFQIFALSILAWQNGQYSYIKSLLFVCVFYIILMTIKSYENTYGIPALGIQPVVDTSESFNPRFVHNTTI